MFGFSSDTNMFLAFQSDTKNIQAKTNEVIGNPACVSIIIVFAH